MKIKSNKKSFLLISLPIFLAIPFVLMVLLEFTFSIAGLGYNFSPFVEASGSKEVWVDNPDLHRKYYSSIGGADIENSKPNYFLKNKKTGVLRGFVVGESTPQGFPYSINQAFPKMTETSLNSLKGSPIIEIINVSKTAMTSYYVRDLAPKLLDYNPDFLVIYVGHNEYYGNFSVSTGGNHFSKNVALWLRQFRIFQLFGDLFAKNDISSDRSLMASKFNGSAIPLDAEKDQEITNNYLDNLEVAIAPFIQKKIPVIIMVPASNLLSLPPFRGAKEGEYKERLNEIGKILQEGKLEVDKFKELANFINQKSSDQAHGIWLNGLIGVLENKPDALKNFQLAKDLDISPFRARTRLLDGLKTKFQNMPGVNVLDLPTEMEKAFSLTAFSNLFFIDHVHFNSAAQSFVSGRLSKVLNDVFKIGIPGPSLASWYSNPQNSQKEVLFNPFDELLALDKVSQLFGDEPFKSMAISYIDSNSAILKTNPLWLNKEFTSRIKGMTIDSTLSTTIDFVNSTDVGFTVLDLVSSIAFQNPGDLNSQMDLFRILAQLPQNKSILQTVRERILTLTSEPTRIQGILNDFETKYTPQNTP